MSILINIIYLLSISLFIFGLKFLSSPRTARKGNILSMLAMFIAVMVTLLDRQIIDFVYIIAGILIGGLIGTIAAKKVQMTAMPQMVAVFNAFGGIASALVVIAQYLRYPNQVDLNNAVTIPITLFIGMLTFTGSMMAFAKLQELMRGAPITFSGQKTLNFMLHLAILVLIVLFILDPGTNRMQLLLLILFLAGLVGITLVLPIGGADMPVVVALLNSYSGLAAAASGFVIHNYILIVSGAIVGASGLILTNLMCKAMNRSLMNVLFAAVGQESDAVATAGKKSVTRYTPVDAAMILENAQSVIIVPGYGLAVAQAQYALQDMVELLQKNGTTVLYAIHPVAGRMPGHMNVLLAEANVPYDLLKDMEEINDEFQTTDVVLVAGANDVINPAAREKGNPLSGMPILQVDQAQSIIIIKRSLSPGFAGVDNELFYDQKTMMVFGDAKEMLLKIGTNLKKE
ncbi:MAG: NAD(P)(+) transhydrogenase (Re/Si-specific) subunit beta [bacterium]|nr:MAG: NAD(P)(+) transhydrogenase (Re/Si-specific) subunit beta [bacterium]